MEMELNFGMFWKFCRQKMYLESIERYDLAPSTGFTADLMNISYVINRRLQRSVYFNLLHAIAIYPKYPKQKSARIFLAEYFHHLSVICLWWMWQWLQIFFYFSAEVPNFFWYTTNLWSVFKNVPNDFHWWLWWEDICISDHEFFQYVILNSSSQTLLVSSL